MLFRQKFLDGIRDGTVTLAFRRWRRPSVRAGGTLLTPVGQLGIASVDEVAITRISEADARSAGYQSRDELVAELRSRDEGTIYRIELGPLRPDPRVALVGRRRSPIESVTRSTRDCSVSTPARLTARGRRERSTSFERILAYGLVICAACSVRRSCSSRSTSAS